MAQVVLLYKDKAMKSESFTVLFVAGLVVFFLFVCDSVFPR